MNDNKSDKNNKTSQTTNANNPDATATEAHLAAQQLLDADTITVTTMIDKVGPMLNYLAECEFAFSHVHEDYEAALYDGRGFLLQMLGDGVDTHCNNINGIFKQFETLKQQNSKTQAQCQLLTKLKANYEKLSTLDGKDAEQATQIQQTIANLSGQLAAA